MVARKKGTRPTRLSTNKSWNEKVRAAEKPVKPSPLRKIINEMVENQYNKEFERLIVRIGTEGTVWLVPGSGLDTT